MDMSLGYGIKNNVKNPFDIYLKNSALFFFVTAHSISRGTKADSTPAT